MARWPGLLCITGIQHRQNSLLLVPFIKLVSSHRDSHASVSASLVSILIRAVLERSVKTHVQLGANSELLKQIPQSIFTCSLISSSVALIAAVLFGPNRGIFGLCALSKILAMW